MKTRIWILASLLVGAALIGCSGNPNDGSKASSSEKVDVPEDIKKSSLPPQAQEEMARRMGKLPEGAAKPNVGADGTITSEAAPAPTGKDGEAKGGAGN